MLRMHLKKKKPKKTRSEVYIMNLTHLGEEYTYEPGEKLTNIKLAKAFNWYAYMADVEEAKEYLGAYLARKNMTELETRLAEVPNTSFPLTAAWLARIEELGADVAGHDDFIMNSVNNAVNRYARKVGDEESTDEQSVPKVKRPPSAFTFIGNLENVIDRKEWTYNVYESLKAAEFPTGSVNIIIDYYEPLLSEIKVALANTDTQVFEGYKGIKKTDLKDEQTWLEKLLADCSGYGSNERKMRKIVRKKKEKAPEKKLKHFAYRKEDIEYKAASVDPVMIIGATEVYLFNVKYRSITVLRGESLDVKGKSVVKHDEKNSFSKTCGRKSAEIVSTISAGGKVSISRALELANGKLWNKAKNLVDENTLILRVTRA